MITIIFLIATAAGFLVHLSLDKLPRTRKRVVELLLLYLFAINVGIGGIMAWYGHTFMADEIARKIGWQPGSPFQFEVAIADLAWGVCGVLCIWLRRGFWVATGIGNSVFLLGCAFGHIRQIVQEGNTAIYNAGPVLWIGDIGVPLTILMLLFIYAKLDSPA